MRLEEWLHKESTGELAASGDFEVEALAAERTLGKKRQFLVKWKVRCCQWAFYVHPLSVECDILHRPSSCATAASGQAEGAPPLAADMVLMLSVPLCEIGLEHVPIISGFAAIFEFTQATWPGTIEAHIGFPCKVGGPQIHKPSIFCAGL